MTHIFFSISDPYLFCYVFKVVLHNWFRSMSVVYAVLRYPNKRSRAKQLYLTKYVIHFIGIQSKNCTRTNTKKDFCVKSCDPSQDSPCEGNRLCLCDGDCGFSCVKTGVYLNRSIFVFSAYTAYEFCSFISTGLIGVVHSHLFFKGSYS